MITLNLEERMKIITDSLRFIAKRTNTPIYKVLDIYNIAYERLHAKYTRQIIRNAYQSTASRLYDAEKEERIFYKALQLTGRYMRRYYEK